MTIYPAVSSEFSKGRLQNFSTIKVQKHKVVPHCITMQQREGRGRDL